MDGSYDKLALEEIIKDRFGLRTDIKEILLQGAPVSHTAEASVILNAKNQLFVLITAQAKLTLGDVRKIITRMGLKPELFLPPKGEPDYFTRIAREHYKGTFPGRANTSSQDLDYYKTLARYQPALVQISEVKDGTIYQFDTDSAKAWRSAKEFSYRRILTS